MSQQPRTDAPGSLPGSVRTGDDVCVDTHVAGDHLLLVLSGEADYDTAATLQEDLGRALTPTTRSVAVDVSRLRFCDLAGMATIHAFCAEVETRRLPLTVHGMSPLLAQLRAMFSPLGGPGRAPVAASRVPSRDRAQGHA